VGTIRRAAQLGIERGVVPPRVDEKRTTRSDGSAIEQFKRVVQEAAKKDQKPSAQVLFDLVTTGTQAVQEFEQEVKSARIYAQLATAGASAASFAHELRKEFDLVDDSVDELEALATRNKALTNEVKSLRLAWNNIKGFVGLFKLIPIKVRREIQNVEPEELWESLQKLVDGIPHTGIEVIPDIRIGPMRLAPAELDSIILNLYTNAVKAIRESDNRTKGRITIRLTAELNDLTVEVLDNGCGVTPAVASVMWEPIEGKFPEGTGMGLPITTFLTGLYGGDVTWVDSPEEGYKTLFRARLRGVVLE
jgi:signal transduction histidine kinase